MAHTMTQDSGQDRKPTRKPSIADPEFSEALKPLLSARRLTESDLQVNVKKEEIEKITCPDNDLIGRDWYSFGLQKEIDSDTLNQIKEDNSTLRDRKSDLLHLLIEPKYQIRYEDIVYFHFKNDQSQFIKRVLDYLVDQRRRTEPYNPKYKKDNKPPKYTERPWQAIYAKRSKAPPVPGPRQELSTRNYQDKFYDTLWYEEKEHTKKLHNKCSGVYRLFVTDDVPPEVKDLLLQPDRYKEFGYIEDDAFTYDKIEYATQASEGVNIYKSNGFVCKASISQHNFSHVEQRLYLCFPDGTRRKLEAQLSHRNGHFKVKMEFELKHSYFNNLQHAVAIIPQYVINCLLSEKQSFSDLEEKFKPHWSEYSFMKLDDVQTQALQMITSVSSKHTADSCPPPVFLYGPFGSGKTRILARAAYEVMTNGVSKGDPFTRILICAHHPQSVNSFIDDYFARIEDEEGELPYRVFHVSRYLGNPLPKSYNSHFYTTFDKLEDLKPEKLKNVIIIASYNASLNLYHIFDVPGYGYFNYVFLDEAAQVREPEAITPLALATRDAKIVLAGDDKQVGPKTLVLGEEAQSDGLDVSLLTRLTDRYKGMGPTAATYVITLSSNYRAHKDLLSLPELFYGKLHASENKPVWHHKGPSGYRFVCSNSRLVPECVAANEEQQLVEACIVLEQPSNILFAMNDSIKVGDFGLVKQNAATKHSAPQTDVQGSHTSEIGTSFYVSPEQEAGHRYNERADVYSLGIILFELYFPFSTVMERAKVLGDVKSNRRLPKEFKENLHNEAKLVELMLKPISDRPSSSEIKEIDAFKQMKDQAELNCDFMLLKF
uniref:Protein kinase domain-containing protein n=1 Tax=Amphimedon queenslandica TaxID=400682 RepID=A0A1X7TQB0_AMPQE